MQISAANSATSDWHENQSKGAKTRLIASFYKSEQGDEKKLIVGVHFKMAAGWKIYGNDSGGIGMPPSFDFAGSKNYSSHKISWPKSEIGEEKIGKELIKYSYYKDEIVVPVEVNLQKNDQPTEITLKLDYGLCKDVCVPASEVFSLKISDEIDVNALQEIQKFFPKKITAEKVATAEKIDAPKKKASRSLTLLSAILLAIFGGAILNIMPCVLPVLSIKLISVLEHSGAKISRIRFAFLSTIFGILSCFILFAVLASAIKLTGNSLGWGLQFQNPYFLIFLILVLMFFIANLLGIFEISFNQISTNLLNKKISQSEAKKNIFVPNFLSGILAVLLATPCSAPFLGSAISFALVENFSVIFLVFIGIGIGFAAPYIALLISPQLVYLLPKSGMWMVKVKQLMSGFLAATVLWLVYILSHNIGAIPALIIAGIATTILLCFGIKSVVFKYLAILAVVITAFAIPSDLKNKVEVRVGAHDAMWREFDEIEIYRQVAKGKIVVVDITADWCLTCKFNKARVLEDKEVVEKLRDGNIVALRGDITKPNEEIMNYLRKNNRFAIPFNAVYGPNAKTGLLASEFLTKKELLELIQKASTPIHLQEAE